MSVFLDVKSKRQQIINIAHLHKVNNIKIFGSIVREEETEDSDIDLLVNCEEQCSLFDLIALKDELESILNKRVDIVSEDSVHWTLKDIILSEAKEI